ncbi:hypothetical protein BDW74DRAFT_172609 [Aspergillus multicolor]|uniref:uncharacterized protein n=1 Tax=Aspergillus multicolor TaxID=41759 RepID=UPI003CCD204D
MSGYTHQTQSSNKDTEYMSVQGHSNIGSANAHHASASDRMKDLQSPVNATHPTDSSLRPGPGVGGGTGTQAPPNSAQSQDTLSAFIVQCPEDSGVNMEYNSSADYVLNLERLMFLPFIPTTKMRQFTNAPGYQRLEVANPEQADPDTDSLQDRISSEHVNPRASASLDNNDAGVSGASRHDTYAAGLEGPYMDEDAPMGPANMGGGS